MPLTKSEIGRHKTIVQKFGGTSVGDARRLSNVANILVQHASSAQGLEGARSIVVVSAMSGVTSQLTAGARAAAEGRDAMYRKIKANILDRHLQVVDALLAHSAERLDVGGLIEDRLNDLERLYRGVAILGELTVRGGDAVASFGEQLSVSILAAVLRDRGARAQALNATELIVTDDCFGAAAPLMDQTRLRLEERLLPLVDRGVIPVVTGYIAATKAGIPTTLGRGGSDYTAAILGAGLDADQVWIWSDVDGILTADPNIVPHAHTLTELSYSEAVDLADFGADVLHPKTIRPLAQSGIPLRILNSFKPDHPGTRIVETPSSDRLLLPAIITTSGLTMIAVGSHDDTWTLEMAANTLQRLTGAGVDVLMFSQSFSEHSLNLVVREQDQSHAINVLGRDLSEGCDLGITDRVATISVVGVPGWNETGIVSHAFAALGKLGTRVITVAQAATEYSVSFCVPQAEVAEAVRFLHRELGLD